MPFLDTLVGLINANLQQNTLTDKRFAAGDFNGIAIPIYRDRPGAQQGKQALPCVYQEGQDAKYVGIDDTFPIIIYHKLQRNTTQPAKTQFGDGDKTIKATTLLTMTVYADRNRIKLSPEDLESLILSGFSDEIPKTAYPSKGFSSIVVYHMETNFNAQGIFAQEYQNVDFFLKPESILFQITYRIESQYRKDCLAICGC